MMYYDYFQGGSSAGIDTKIGTLFKMYSGVYQIIVTLGVIVMILSALYILGSMMMGNAKERSEGKVKLTGNIIASMILFSFAGLMEVLIHIVVGFSL